jgi:hypothetical protein
VRVVPRLGVAALVVVAAFVAACAPRVTLTPLGAERVYPPTPDSVAIPLYASTTPACPYEEIAALTVEGAGALSSDADVLEALRAKARAVGAQAIIGYAQANRASTGQEPLLPPGKVRVRNGTAIRFRSPTCTA